MASFIGTVRDRSDGRAVAAMELEHYPGMTEAAIEAMIDQAFARFEIRAVRVIHRIGKLEAREQIVLVVVASAHRGQAFQACEFGATLSRDAYLSADDAALARWGIASGNAAAPSPAPPHG